MSHPLLARIWGLRNPRRLSSVVLRRFGLSHLFTIQTSGIRLRFFPAAWTITLWESPDFFTGDTELLRRWLRRGDVLVDCGANVGLLTLVGAQCVGPRGRVFSIEAHPKIFGFLKANVALNSAANVTLFHAAAGEAEGAVSFSDHKADDGNHILPGGTGIAVAMRPLDALVPEGTRVRLLKLDVEGYEKPVLEGARRLLPGVEAVYCESSDMLFGRYGYTCADLFALLQDRGFTTFRFAGEGRLFRLPQGYVSQEIENLVAVRDVDGFLAATGYRTS